MFLKISEEQFLKDCLKSYDYIDLEKYNIEDADIEDKELAAKRDKFWLSHYDDIKLPVRATNFSAGYDISCPINFNFQPGEQLKVVTGLKARIKSRQYLAIHIRSSTAIKKGLVLANQVGIVDADYFNNEDNEGHIILFLRNITDDVVSIDKGERVAQAIIQSYYVDEKTCNSSSCNRQGRTRRGGFGSTN